MKIDINSTRGFSPLLVILVIIAVLAGVGVYVFVHHSSPTQYTTTSTNVTASSTAGASQNLASLAAGASKTYKFQGIVFSAPVAAQTSSKCSEVSCEADIRIESAPQVTITQASSSATPFKTWVSENSKSTTVATFAGVPALVDKSHGNTTYYIDFGTGDAEKYFSISYGSIGNPVVKEIVTSFTFSPTASQLATATDIDK